MVIDYTSGDYTNIHIENVESWHGEANGLTIYKESFVNLGNIQVHDIHAGTKLNDDDVSQLNLPNLIPRACALDIHDDTVIDYIYGQDIDHIRHKNIFGFDTCDQFGGDKNNNNHDHFGGAQTSISSFNFDDGHILSIILAIILITVSGFIVYFIYHLIEYIKKNNNESLREGRNRKELAMITGAAQETDDESTTYTLHGDDNRLENIVNINEKTPLLDTI